MEKRISKWKGTPEEHEALRELAAKLAGLMKPQAKELGKVLKDEHGIEISSDVVSLPTNVEVDAVEQTEFDVHLSSFGGSKLPIVKKVKELFGMGLKDSMELINRTPINLREGVDKEEAEMLKKELEALGATIELK